MGAHLAKIDMTLLSERISKLLNSPTYTTEPIPDFFQNDVAYPMSRNKTQSSKLDEVPVEDMGLVQEIFQREGAFSTSESKKPILATFGIGPCVSVVGYSQDLKRGFVTHYDALTDRDFFGKFDDPYWLPKSLMSASYWGSKGAENIVTYDVQIIQGSHDPTLLAGLEKQIDNINNWNSDKIKLDVVNRDVDEVLYGGKTIALDLRTGESFSYDPLKNPDMRELSEFDGMRLSIPSPLDWKIDETLKN